MKTSIVGNHLVVPFEHKDQEGNIVKLVFFIHHQVVFGKGYPVNGDNCFGVNLERLWEDIAHGFESPKGQKLSID